MNIVICVKQVPDTNLQIRLNRDGSDIDRENLSYVMSPYDEFAVEEACRIKERFLDSRLTAVSLGPVFSDEVLRQALAMGADDAVHILDSDVKLREGLITANALARVLQPMNPDLILTGRQAVDDDGFQVPGALAVLLGFPEVAVASAIALNPAKRTCDIERNLEGGVKQIIEAPLPCVITCQKGINEPRYPSLPGIMKAKKKSIKTVKVEELGIRLDSRIEPEKLEIPQIQRKGRILDGDSPAQVSELVRLLREEARII